jgi:16S rRNA (guanine1516-N2)-methyltransferase
MFCRYFVNITSSRFTNVSFRYLSSKLSHPKVSIYNNILASRINWECNNSCSYEDEDGLILNESKDNNVLELIHGPKSKIKEKPFFIDFIEMKKQRNNNNGFENVCKSIGNINNFKQKGYVIDLNAGLGRDSFILALHGHHVIMIERNPVLFVLLKDAIHRLKLNDEKLADRLYLINNDATFDSLDIQLNDIIKKIKKNMEKYDLNSNTIELNNICIYLDPMYPSKTIGKKSLVKKETQILHRLVAANEGDDNQNNNSLFDKALKLIKNSSIKSKIVVKRPLKAQALVNSVPHECTRGISQRFDIYFPNAREILFNR